MGSYNKRLSVTDQIGMEERIASAIYDVDELTEETAADLGRAILKMVLSKFRVDLFDDKELFITTIEGFEQQDLVAMVKEFVDSGVISPSAVSEYIHR